jgi:hypothetical protein
MEQHDASKESGIAWFYRRGEAVFDRDRSAAAAISHVRPRSLGRRELGTPRIKGDERAAR